MNIYMDKRGVDFIHNEANVADVMTQMFIDSLDKLSVPL